MATKEHANRASGNGTEQDSGITEKLLFAKDDLIVSESLPDGLDPGNSGLLSLKDIQVRLDTDYSRLTRLAAAPGIGEYVGAVTTSAKGVRYEPRALDVFRRLIAASDAKELTPATATAWLKLHEEVKPSSTGETAITESRGITEKPLFGNGSELTTRGLAAIFSPMVSILQEVRDLLHDFKSGRAQIAPAAAPMPDRLLTAEEAGALLACSPRSVSRYVTPVRHRTWRESDCLRYIELLGQDQKIK